MAIFCLVFIRHSIKMKNFKSMVPPLFGYGGYDFKCMFLKTKSQIKKPHCGVILAEEVNANCLILLKSVVELKGRIVRVWI